MTNGKFALLFGAVAGIRTLAQALSGVLGGVVVYDFFLNTSAAGELLLAGVIGAVIAGLVAFFQNFAEEFKLLKNEDSFVVMCDDVEEYMLPYVEAAYEEE